MRFIIFENGMEINRIAASESFVTCYCDKNSYTYKEIETPAATTVEEPTTLETLSAENTKLKAQIQLQAQQQEFLENCILEMADTVYA